MSAKWMWYEAGLMALLLLAPIAWKFSDLIQSWIDLNDEKYWASRAEHIAKYGPNYGEDQEGEQ